MATRDPAPLASIVLSGGVGALYLAQSSYHQRGHRRQECRTRVRFYEYGRPVGRSVDRVANTGNRSTLRLDLFFSARRYLGLYWRHACWSSRTIGSCWQDDNNRTRIYLNTKAAISFATPFIFVLGPRGPRHAQWPVVSLRRNRRAWSRAKSVFLPGTAGTPDCCRDSLALAL